MIKYAGGTKLWPPEDSVPPFVVVPPDEVVPAYAVVPPNEVSPAFELIPPELVWPPELLLPPVEEMAPAVPLALLAPFPPDELHAASAPETSASAPLTNQEARHFIFIAA